MARSSSGGVSPRTAPGPPVAPRTAGPGREPSASNSWARRATLARAGQLGVPPETGKRVGNVALWYYNRLLQRLNPPSAPGAELAPNTNRYLVPICLALACDYTKQPVALDRLLRIGASPTPDTVENAHRLLARYRQLLVANRRGAAGARPARGATPHAARPPALAPPAFQVRPAPPVPPRVTPLPRPAASPAPTPPITALAKPLPEEIARLRQLSAGASASPGAGPATRPRHANTNAWARKRIAELCRSQRLPERVRRRSLELYDRIVDLHSARMRAPAGRRVQLSPRLNWSLAYTCIYLGCRSEEFPRELRDILGGNPRPGTLREMYRLYRFYKRELRLTINLVDVKTFIQSWIDGFPLSELVREKVSADDAVRLQRRAVAIANRARTHAAFRRTSTKMIAAGALTTALAERDPPSSLAAFYRAIAAFLHMGEEAIRFVTRQLEAIL